MNAEQYKESMKWLKRSKATPKPFFWFFTVKGPEGDPGLLVGKKKSGVKSEGRQYRTGSQDKKFATGKLLPDSKGKLLFCVDDGNAPIKQVQRAFRLQLSKAEGFKKVKALLKTARIVTPEDFVKEFGTIEEEDETKSLEDMKPSELLDILKPAMERAKTAYQAAKGRTGDTEAWAAVEAALKTADQLRRDESKVQEAVDAFLELAELADSYGLEEDEVDFVAMNRIWQDALADTQNNLNRLKDALSNTTEDELREIATKGLPEIAKDYRVKFQATLFDAERSSGKDRDDFVVDVANQADEFLKHLKTSEQVKVVDDNDWYDVGMLETLGGALQKISEMV